MEVQAARDDTINYHFLSNFRRQLRSSTWMVDWHEVEWRHEMTIQAASDPFFLEMLDAGDI